VHDKQGIADGSAVFAPAFHNLFLVTQAQNNKTYKAKYQTPNFNFCFTVRMMMKLFPLIPDKNN